jgi:hypothetical protein|tara:strand:- start:887 stop:1108 length:222 start_codon:yes stop_codon:yes gene_type:complete
MSEPYSKQFVLHVKLDDDYGEEENQKQVWTALTQLKFWNFFEPKRRMQLIEEYETWGDDVQVTIELEEIRGDQ